jgi:preprotein translocase subunit SecD
MVLIISGCSTSKKVTTDKSEVNKSTIEQESTKKEMNASGSVIVVDSSQVDKDVIAEFEITRTTVVKPDSTTIKESIKGIVKSNSKEKKAVTAIKTDSINKTNKTDKLKAKIDTEKKEATKIRKKTRSINIWWYLGLGAIVVVLLWLNKGKISKWLVRLIRGK